MKIQSIEVNNYKAFHGKYRILVKGKNLFIYGENGSGKSSIYYALKDFFQSSMEDIDLSEVENTFVKSSQKGKCSIAVTFKPNSEGHTRNQKHELTATSKNTDSGTDTSIRDANKLKSFLTYKHLLDIHHLKKDQKIDLFNLLVNGVLRHFKYSLTGGKELGELWQEVKDVIAKKTDRSYNETKKKRDVNAALKEFNEAFGELFKEGSPECILNHANPILDQFNHNIELKLLYTQARPDSEYKAIENNYVHLEIKYAGQKVKKPHLFLNEARLSAIAISIYLGMIKRHVQLIPCKVLFLDDIFIGLDISNRLPLLKILKTEFPDYQTFITTYDKPWYEYAKSYLAGVPGWTTLELYAVKTKHGYEIPLINHQDLLAKSQWHYDNSDYKASAVYARSAFEKILRKYCDKKRRNVVFKQKAKNYTSEDFWTVIKDEVNATTKTTIEQYRDLVLNPFSHYNMEKHEFKSELQDTINAVQTLKTELDNV